MGATKINHEQNHIGAIVDYLRIDRRGPHRVRISRYYVIELASPLFSILLFVAAWLIIQCRIILIFVVPRTGPARGSCEIATRDSSICTHISVVYLLSCGSRAARATCVCYLHSFCLCFNCCNCKVKFVLEFFTYDPWNQQVISKQCFY